MIALRKKSAARIQSTRSEYRAFISNAYYNMIVRNHQAFAEIIKQKASCCKNNADEENQSEEVKKP